MHVHDLVPYLEGGQHHDFGHIIHKFSFGSEEEQRKQNSEETERLKKKLDISDPLTGIKAHTEESNYMFQYFLKVVSTRFETIDQKVLATHQYSVTSYERDLSQGNAPTKEGGHTTTHGFAGVPGVFFSVGDDIGFCAFTVSLLSYCSSSDVLQRTVRDFSDARHPSRITAVFGTLLDVNMCHSRRSTDSGRTH